MASSDHPVLKVLFEEHRDRLLRFLTAKLGSAEDAADVAQEAYLRLLGAERLEQLENPRAFLFRTAFNLAVDRLRHERRIARQRGDLLVQIQAGQTPGARSPVASPEAELERRDRLRKIAAVINALPAKCRRAFVLHRFEGYTYAEIARELGVSRSMVEKYLMRAYEHCRKHLL